MKRSKTVAIVQARMGSQRLPGKVLKEVCGKPLLWHLFSRLKSSHKLDKVVLATTNLAEDKILLKEVKTWGFDVFAGEKDDVLDRYYSAAKYFEADLIVRITGDCPLIDPQIVDLVINRFLSLDEYDLVTTDDTFPDGLDTAVFSFQAIKKASEEANLPSEREHVGPYILNHPDLFQIEKISYQEDLSSLRWTVDEERDLKLVQAIFQALYREDAIFYFKDILNLLKKNPELAKINVGIARNEGLLKSLENDKVFIGEELQN